MLWARESEQGAFDTPERRAALEARIGEVTNAIADESVRRYYRQDFSARLRQMFAPKIDIATRQQISTRTGLRQDHAAAARRPGHSRPSCLRDETYVAASANLRPARCTAAIAPRSRCREALILQAALNHPWLLHDHMEELAEAEFRHADTQKLKSALIDVFAHHSRANSTRDSGTGQRRRPRRARRRARPPRLCRLLGRIERSITTSSVWGAQPQAARDDVLLTWKQLVALHRQWHSLTRELKDAELALGQDNSETNYTRLLDVKARLSSLDGTEALIEGFGASSGRPARSM